MKKTVFLESSLVQFLGKLTNDGYAQGLLLGQASEENEFVIHMTRTHKNHKHFDDLKENDVIDHIRNVIQILPGGVTILGLFFVGAEKLFANTAAVNKVKDILNSIIKLIEKSEFHFIDTTNTSKLFLHCVDSNNVTCKRFVPSKSGNQFEVVECSFESKSWHKINCYYDFEQLLPLYVKTVSNSILNDKFMGIINYVDQSVRKSVLLLNGKVRKNNELLKSVKEKSSKRAQNSKDDDIPIVVDIYSPFGKFVTNNSCEITDFVAELKCHGTLCSEVYLHENATVKQAVQAVQEDIIRSLHSRLTMHCNSLLEDLSSSIPDESKIIHEPPRRISIQLPHSKVCFTDYLFPGEDTVSLLPVKEQLDLDLTDDISIFKELETETDANVFYAKDTVSPAENSTVHKRRLNYALLVGILFSFLIVIFAVFFQKSRSS